MSCAARLCARICVDVPTAIGPLHTPVIPIRPAQQCEMVRKLVSPGLLGNLLRLEATGKVSCGLGLGASAFFPPSQFDLFLLCHYAPAIMGKSTILLMHSCDHTSFHFPRPTFLSRIVWHQRRFRISISVVKTAKIRPKAYVAIAVSDTVECVTLYLVGTPR